MLRGSTLGIPQRHASLDAPLAQSVERFHGKEEVFGSNPERGSACRPLADTMRQENCRRASWLEVISPNLNGRPSRPAFEAA